MKLLVLAEAYPMPDGTVSLMYIHTRNLYYKKLGADVTVLNFRAAESTEFEGIKIITLKDFEQRKDGEQFDLLVSHASNVRHHYRFIRKYGSLFPQHVFVFHGHEVLRWSTAYPKLFPWKKQNNPLTVAARDVYDTLKLHVWKRYFENPKNTRNASLIFVSKWMMDEFLKNTRTKKSAIEGYSYIIHNSVGRLFEEREYVPEEKKYDFITIRSSIDGEKYCIDVVNELAKRHPQYKFLLVGRGELFDHIEKAENLEWQNRNLFHEEMFELLSASRFALMPTKTDAQGLMMCEMATYGIPVITSDIPVCHEVLDDFGNVGFISNDGTDDLSVLIEKLEGTKPSPNGRNEKFYQKNTSGKEYELFKKLSQKS